MPKFICTNPPQTLEVKIGAMSETYEFPDTEPVDVSDAAALLLDDEDEDDFERAD